MQKKLCIGLDFGTDSVRAVLVDTSDGSQLSSAVYDYPRWKKGLYCNASDNQFRQHPADHIEGMEQTIVEIMKRTNTPAEQVVGICIDTTGSSPLPVDKYGTALALQPEFAENPNAMMILWKDHTGIPEANEINELSHTWGGTDFTQFSGGIYSPEWFWSKILHVIREDAVIKNNAWSWMEHCDYMTFLLTGSMDLSTLKRSRCAAGHKAMWHTQWNGLPDKQFLAQLDPYLAELSGHLYTETFTSDKKAGYLDETWAEKLGLSKDVIVAVGTLDAHAGAVGAEAKESTLVRVMGTSTCDMIVSSREQMGEHLVKGICGQVDGSIVPDMIGMEAGQSAFGDMLAWYRDLLSWPVDHILTKSSHLDDSQKEILRDEIKNTLLDELAAEAKKLPLEENVPLSLDWINGRRTPDANQSLKSTITSLNLGTDAPRLYRSLVEAICFGSKMIVDRFRNEGVDIRLVVAIGGVAEKSPYVMQTLANILNMTISISAAQQAPALGAAMYAAVASGVHDSVSEAVLYMGQGSQMSYHPEGNAVMHYNKQYALYKELAYSTEYGNSSIKSHNSFVESN